MGQPRTHAHLDIGELALKELRRLGIGKAELASAHVLMSHIYTQATEMRRVKKNEKLHKLPGKSCIEVDGLLHTFRVGDTSHPDMKEIVAINEELHQKLTVECWVRG